jgi:NADH-quinone oxidoreductase subunit F
VRLIDNIEAGRGTREDVELLLDVCNNIEGNTICPHGDAAAMAVRSYLKKFTQEFYDHVERGCCPFKPWNLPGHEGHNH